MREAGFSYLDSWYSGKKRVKLEVHRQFGEGRGTWSGGIEGWEEQGTCSDAREQEQ